MKSFLMVCVVSLCLFSFVGCNHDDSLRGELTSLARQNKYWEYDGTVAVPYTCFPASKLSEWKRFSQEKMEITTDGGIFKICVHFNKVGTEINGVSIVWHGSELTAGFPYKLSNAETESFVKKAEQEMRRG